MDVRAAPRRDRDPTRTIKEDLRRRCLVRAAAQRQALLGQHRQASMAISMASIVAEELRKCCSGGAEARPSAWSEMDEARLQEQLGQDAYLELMAATEESLLREMHQVEALAQAGGADNEEQEYEEYLAAEDALYAQSAAEGAEPSLLLDADASSMEDRVLCPLCVRARLVLLPDGCIACSAAGDGCMLRLDARGHPAPLALLRERMDRLLREHSQHCQGAPCCRLPLPAERHVGMLLFCCVSCGTATGVV